MTTSAALTPDRKFGLAGIGRAIYFAISSHDFALIPGNLILPSDKIRHIPIISFDDL